MEKTAIYHLNDSSYCFATSLNRLVIRLRTKRDDPDISKIEVMVMRKFANKQTPHVFEMHKRAHDDLFDYYQAVLTIRDSRLMYGFYLYDKAGKRHCYGEMGFCESFDDFACGDGYFQMPYVNKADLAKENEKFSGRIFYQIFPDRFAIGGEPALKPTMGWGDRPDRVSFAGGNLRGIIEHLDYLKNLGIGGIYLTPVWKSDSNHRYDTLDYGHVDPRLGSDEDLVELVKKCHEMDILVMLDLVYNHTSFRHPCFQDVLKRGKESPYYDWYIIHHDPVRFLESDFEHFGKARYMPKLNMSNPTCADHFVEVAFDIVKRYGIDAYRIDVADEISHRFYTRLNNRLKDYDPDFLIIGENWHEASSFLNSGLENDGTMNYALRSLLIKAFAEEKMTAKDLEEKITSLWFRYKEGTSLNMLNLLSSHDTPRFLTLCHEDKARFLSAYAFLLLFPGIPYVYYGDERGMVGGDDPDCRRCLELDKNDPEIYEPIEKLIHLRKKIGKTFKGYSLTHKGDVLALTLSHEGGTLSVLINMGEDIPFESNVAPEASYRYDGKTLKHMGFAAFSKKIVIE